jgi:hypothetical protein
VEQKTWTIRQEEEKKNYFVAGSHKKMLKESKFEFLFDWNRK